jgi:Tol biopolymer transport system component
VDSAGVQGNGASGFSRISTDGRYIAFESFAANLVPGDRNGALDVFVHDLQNGQTERVSVDSSGVEGDMQSSNVAISADGRFVAFTSHATNLVPGDTNGAADIFVRDRVAGQTFRVSVDSSDAQANNQSMNPALSADGRYVGFFSSATNLVAGDTNGANDVFVHDLLTGETTRVSVDSSGAQGNGPSAYAALSADGRYVAFISLATNLVANDTNGTWDVFVHDRATGHTTLESVDSNGAQGNVFGTLPAISADGRYVAFASLATNLVPNDTNGALDVFVHDRITGRTTRVSVDSSRQQGDENSWGPSFSPDGRFVAFYSDATNLVAGDVNGVSDVFVHDLLTYQTTLISVDTAGMQANSNCYAPSISADGRYVTFYGYASNLVPDDTNSWTDVFLRDRGAASSFASFCAGDGLTVDCPCSNAGSMGHGCDNSIATGGASLSSSGTASLSADTAQLTCTDELPTALSIVLQGSTVIAPANFGDGLRCAGGVLKRLYVKHAVGGTISAPQAGDPPISTRSAALGDTIPLGATRAYQVYYRDANLGFCPAGFNASNAIAIAWGT